MCTPVYECACLCEERVIGRRDARCTGKKDNLQKKLNGILFSTAAVHLLFSALCFGIMHSVS